MSQDYIPFDLKVFNNIQAELIKKYQDFFTSAKLETAILDWNQENFLSLYSTLQEIFDRHNLSVIRSRFFYTPAKKSREPHVDGKFLTDDYWALNIPITAGKDNHWVIWYDYDGELLVVDDKQYHNSISAKHPEKLVERDRLIVDRPHFVKIGNFHNVINDSSTNRLILSLRFNRQVTEEKVLEIVGKESSLLNL